MWLRSPSDHSIADSLDDIREAPVIHARKQAGWTNVEPIYIKHASTGVVHLVTHPAHQSRLLSEGGTRVGNAITGTVTERDKLNIDRIAHGTDEEVEQVLVALKARKAQREKLATTTQQQ